MDIQEIKKFLSENKDSADVQGLVKELGQAAVSEFKASKEWKDELQKEGDRRVTGALDKFQKETMPKHIEDEIKKRFPDETPEQKALRELKIELDAIKNEKNRETLKNKKIKAFNDKKIPLDLSDYLAIDNEENLESVIDNFSKVYSEAVTAGVNDRLKSAGVQKPEKSASSPNGVITTKEEIQELYKKDPSLVAAAQREGRIQLNQ